MELQPESPRWIENPKHQCGHPGKITVVLHCCCCSVNNRIRKATTPALSPTGSFRAYTFWTLSEALSRLYQRRFLRPRPHFSAFFKLYIFSFAPFQISLIFQDLCTIFGKIRCNSCWFSLLPADFVIFRQILTDFFRNFAEFQWFRKEWCQDSHISEKSEKFCRNFIKFWCKIAGNLSEKNGSSKSPRR